MGAEPDKESCVSGAAGGGTATHPGLERLLLEGVEGRRRWRSDGDSLAGHYVDIFSLWGVWGRGRFSTTVTPTPTTTHAVVLEALEQLAWKKRNTM